MGEIINPNSSPEIPVNSNTVNQEITTSVRTVEPGRSDNESNEQSLFGVTLWFYLHGMATLV